MLSLNSTTLCYAIDTFQFHQIHQKKELVNRIESFLLTVNLFFIGKKYGKSVLLNFCLGINFKLKQKIWRHQLIINISDLNEDFFFSKIMKKNKLTRSVNFLQ